LTLDPRIAVAPPLDVGANRTRDEYPFGGERGLFPFCDRPLHRPVFVPSPASHYDRWLGADDAILGLESRHRGIVQDDGLDASNLKTETFYAIAAGALAVPGVDQNILPPALAQPRYQDNVSARMPSYRTDARHRKNIECVIDRSVQPAAHLCRLYEVDRPTASLRANETEL